MDEEDLTAASDAQQMQTNQSFAGLGSTENDENQRRSLMDLFRPTSETMGVKLLRRMGWREGEGIGPKSTRKSASKSTLGGPEDDIALKAPPDPPMISFSRKNDRKGLGHHGETRLNEQHLGTGAEVNKEDKDNEIALGSYSTTVKSKSKSKKDLGGGPHKTAFGVGVLNDDGSDEDPYSIGPRISYNRTIGGDHRTKKAQAQASTVVKPTLKPSLKAKHVFRSKPSPFLQSLSRCHDGRLPLAGFILVQPLAAVDTESSAKYALPVVPDDWQPAKQVSRSEAQDQEYQSTADAAKSSTLDSKARASLLGEKSLPGKSVFDFISPETRDRIASVTNNQNLPPGRGEQGPRHDSKVAQKPASEAKVDQEGNKQAPAKPMSNLMSSRFTSAGVSLPSDDSLKETIPSEKKPRAKDPAEEAASLEMYGPMTRSYQQFYPTRIVCKRFNVKLPTHVENEGEAKQTKELLSAKTMEHMKTEASLHLPKGPGGVKGGSEITKRAHSMDHPRQSIAGTSAEVDASRNEALEGQKAGEEVFKAIFGDDDSD